MKCEGIQGIRRLTKHHPEVLVSQLHSVTLAIIAEVRGLFQTFLFICFCLTEAVRFYFIALS